MMRASNTEKKVMRCAELFEFMRLFYNDSTGSDEPERRAAAANTRRMRRPRASSGQKAIEIAQHASRCAPNEGMPGRFVARVRHRKKTTPAAFPAKHAHTVPCRIHQESQRYFEDIGYFERVRLDGKRRMHESDDRRDAKAGARQIVR